MAISFPLAKSGRTGANEATTFVPSSDVVVGGATVPAGSYTIFTVPAADKWTLIINKTTGEWGIPYKYESNELARVNMKVSKLPSPVEDFTISYAKSGTVARCRLIGRRREHRWTLALSKTHCGTNFDFDC